MGSESLIEFTQKKPRRMPCLVLGPKSINYNVDRSAYEVDEEIEVKIETANFIGMIDDSINIEKIVCLSSDFIENKRNFPTDFQITSIEIQNKMLSPSDPKSVIKLKVKFYVFFDLNFQYFYSYPSAAHVYDVYVNIPVTSKRGTEVKKTVVPIYVSK